MSTKESEDISLVPNRYADTSEEIIQSISHNILEKYDVYSYQHAATILKNSFSYHLEEIEAALEEFSITTYEIGIPGGNESVIPKKISANLRPQNWVEQRIQGDLHVRVKSKVDDEEIILPNYIDGHKIDYVKGKVAFDLEWNSKDQTYDRDLYAFRTFYECGVISVAIIVTRSEKLNEVFEAVPKRKKDGSIVFDEKTEEPIPAKEKYGASTTWIGKLLYRLNAGRHGGCPVLVFAIRPEAVEDWPILLEDRL